MTIYSTGILYSTTTTTSTPTRSPTSLWDEDEPILPGQGAIGVIKNLAPLYVEGLNTDWDHADFAQLRADLDHGRALVPGR